MEFERSSDELSVIEAVNILSNMAEIDVHLGPPMSDLEYAELGEEAAVEINWRDPRQALFNESIIKEIFRILHRYIQNIVRKDPKFFEDPKTYKGMQAIVFLSREAAEKMDRYADLYPDTFRPISKLKEYTDLNKYYKQHILGQMPEPKEIPEDWEGVFEEELEEQRAGEEGIEDFEAVRKDREYELFFIKNEKEKVYFSSTLLRHVRLVGNFDAFVSEVEGGDPLIGIRELFDHELLEGAQEIIRLAAPYMDPFYKEAMGQKDRPFIAAINKAIMALRMAANSKNLIGNQSYKSCLEYYGDFQRFLRAALQAPGYKMRISGEIEEDAFTHVLLNLTHALCCFFFMRIEPKKRGLALIHKMVQRGDEMRGKRPKTRAEIPALEVWQDLSDEDESLRFLLSHYPNGPILRTLDAFREGEALEGFDPLSQGNFPSQLFTFSSNHLHISVLRLPCPTKQRYINRVDVAEEFRGFMRYYLHELKPDRHLLMNLQDRTSWKEFARCRAIEEIAREAEFFETLFVVGLPKSTPFFFQNGEYEPLSGAEIFIEKFKEQFMGKEEYGFRVPEAISTKDLSDFFDRAALFIHRCFFDLEATLKHRERLSFIEIFYLLLTLKCVEWLKVDSISFTCKDGVDTSMGQTAVFFAFLRLLCSQNSWSGEDKDQLLWFLYSPALFVRDRAIQQDQFKRGIKAIEALHKGRLNHGEKIVEGLKQLFPHFSLPFDLNVLKED